jgi:hypothetical protein
VVVPFIGNYVIKLGGCMDSTRFTEIANQLLNECKKYQCDQSNCGQNLMYNAHPCPDDVMGDGKDFWFKEFERKDHKKMLNIEKSTLNYDKTMVIILESPHIDEYSEPTFIHPALGKTGKALMHCFPSIYEKAKSLYDANNEYTWRVILMNSIQYQCSLGENTKIYRDHMWLKLWFDGKCSEDFIDRLRSYQPDIIYNFCTKGDHENEPGIDQETEKGFTVSYIQKCAPEYFISNSISDEKILQNGLRGLVKNKIDELPNIKLYIEGNHPSSWPRNRKFRNVTYIKKDSFDFDYDILKK